MTTSWRALGLLTILAMVASGCSRWLDLVPPTTVTESRSNAPIDSDERVPLVLQAVKITQNGSPQNPSVDIERRFLGSVQELGLFSSVSQFDTKAVAGHSRYVSAMLSIDNIIDPHSGEAAWKGMVIGASMFLLSPLIELAYDYGTLMTLELERWDGSVKKYHAHASGTARYELFGATPVMIDELKGHVLEACINNLIDQVANDTTFYVASSAPLPDSPIHTIVVKARKPLAVSPISVVPVSIAPAPSR